MFYLNTKYEIEHCPISTAYTMYKLHGNFNNVISLYRKPKKHTTHKTYSLISNHLPAYFYLHSKYITRENTINTFSTPFILNTYSLKMYTNNNIYTLYNYTISPKTYTTALLIQRLTSFGALISYKNKYYALIVMRLPLQSYLNG